MSDPREGVHEPAIREWQQAQTQGETRTATGLEAADREARNIAQTAMSGRSGGKEQGSTDGEVAGLGVVRKGSDVHRTSDLRDTRRRPARAGDSKE
eukprot:2934638-Rhodomonas_salina.1